MYTSIVFINNFIRDIAEIEEYDFGDFMRRANNYLIVLMNRTYRSSTPEVKKLLIELQYIIQFQPDWDVESTRNKIFAKAELIRQYQIAKISELYLKKDQSPKAHYW